MDLKYGKKNNIGIVESIITINIVVFIITSLFRQTDLFKLIYFYGALHVSQPFPITINNGAYWQLLTAIFMHGSFFHIFMNMFILYMFGKPLEQRMGKLKFLFFYIIVGILANLASAIFFILVTKEPVSLIGASGAIFGVLLAFGGYFPDSRLLIFFIIPMKTKWAILLYAGLELFAEIGGNSDGIAHITHLFGFLFGYLYLLVFFRMNPIKEMYFPKKSNDYYYYQ